MGWSRSGSPYPNGCAMKSATIKYLQSSFSKVKDIQDHGKKQTLFGNGTEDIVLNQSGIFTDLVNSYNTSGVLEYRNVTINSGVNIIGTKQRDDSRRCYLPFYLKVNGTLTVNGHLHMDGLGGDASWQRGDNDHVWSVEGINYPYIFESTIKFNIDNYMLSRKQYKDLYNYGKSNPFFNGKVGLTGSGCVYKTKHKKHHNNYGYGKWVGSCLNSGGIPHQGGSKSNTWGKWNFKGSGGGFLALYYESLDNKYASTYTFSDGSTVPMNIHANASWYYGSTPYSGGGMMIIAARNIVIGPKGSITCDGGANPNGGCGFMNYPSNENSDSFSTRMTKQLIFNNGYPYYTSNFDYKVYYSGGSGICFGYQVDPSYGGSI